MPSLAQPSQALFLAQQIQCCRKLSEAARRPAGRSPITKAAHAPGEVKDALQNVSGQAGLFLVNDRYGADGRPVSEHRPDAHMLSLSDFRPLDEKLKALLFGKGFMGVKVHIADISVDGSHGNFFAGDKQIKLYLVNKKSILRLLFIGLVFVARLEARAALAEHGHQIVGINAHMLPIAV